MCIPKDAETIKTFTDLLFAAGKNASLDSWRSHETLTNLLKDIRGLKGRQEEESAKPLSEIEVSDDEMKDYFDKKQSVLASSKLYD